MDAQTIFHNIVLMSYDADHYWWFQPPFRYTIDRSLPISYTILNDMEDICIYLKRRYDMIHELLHVFMYFAGFRDVEDEVIANLSELLEINSLKCFPDNRMFYIFGE